MENTTQDHEPNYKLLAIFPIEIWHSILMCLDDYKDFSKIYNSSAFFKNLLQPLRTVLLFRNIFGILFGYRFEPSNQRTRKENMLLRRVCSSWRSGVDSVVHNLSPPFYSEYCPMFECLDDLEEFLTFFNNENDTINPFPQRSLQICVRFSMVGLPLYYSQLLEMLRKFGHQVWYCKVKMSIEDPGTYTEFFEQFVQILKQMPKLQQLQFKNLTNPTTRPVELPTESLEFPTLKRLLYLDIPGLPASVARQLLEVNRQVYEVRGEHWPIHLETFNRDSLCVNIDSIKSWVKLQNSRVASPLKYLTLNLYADAVPWNSLFSTLNHHFGKTLVKLVFYAPNHSNIPKSTYVTNEDYTSLGKLCNFKVLELYTKHAVALDFLLPIRQTLEHLTIWISKRNANDEFVNQSEVMVKFHRFGKQIQDSNIWQLFCNLKSVSVEREPNRKIVYNRL